YFDSFLLRRFDSTGTATGVASAPDGYLRIAGLALQPDGKVNVVGARGYPGFADFLVIRYTATLQFDTGFGTGGSVRTDFTGPVNSEVRAVAVQRDGKIIAVGTAGGDFALVRYNPDGSLDASFGNGGKVTTDLSGSVDRVVAVALQPDGK